MTSDTTSGSETVLKEWNALALEKDAELYTDNIMRYDEIKTAPLYAAISVCMCNDKFILKFIVFFYRIFFSFLIIK